MKNFLLLLLVFPFGVNAQKMKRSFPERLFTENNTAISFNPFALAEIDFTALAGYENRLAPKLYLSNEAGYIFASNYIGNDGTSSNNGTGFLIRPSLKWFVTDNGKFYLQPQIFYKQVTHKMHDWLGKAAVNRVPSYEQLQDFKYRRKIYGFNTVAGFVLSLDQHKKGYMDFYFGLGIRNKKTVIAGEPNSVYKNSDGMFADMDNGLFPSIPMGIRIIYALH
jgi:hypothetical protein